MTIPSAIRIERQRYYARLFRRRPPYRFRALSESRRVLEMATYLRVTLLQCTDTALMIGEQLSQALRARAARDVEEDQVRATNDFRQILQSIRSLLNDESVADTELRTAIDRVMPHNHELFPSRAAAVRWRLAELTRPVRRLLRLLLELEYRADSDNPLLTAIKTVRICQQKGLRELPRHATTEFAPRWAALIEQSRPRWALRAYEAAVLVSLCRGRCVTAPSG